MMPRNLKRRIEILYPILDENIRKEIINTILSVHLQDNVKARRLLPDGSYLRKQPEEGEELVNAQQWLLDNRGVWNTNISMKGA